MTKIQTIRWQNGCVKLIDQTLLPGRFKLIYCRDVQTLWQAIRRLSVRGAPALGAAAAYGVVLGANTFKGTDRPAFDRHVTRVCAYIATSRPTAVNLFHALRQMQDVLKAFPRATVPQARVKLKAQADRIFNEDRRVCRSIGEHGARLIKNNQSVMTICNAGALATVDYGTALGVFYSAQKDKKKFHVYACETRPLLQGARLTAWELTRAKIPATLICDSMAATVMKQGKVDMIVTGADRIAANGDAANKIGTYSLAVLAKHHKIPFYIAAPFTTFDLSIRTGKDIPIEERDPSEVCNFAKQRTAPKNMKVFNPAFDVTDAKLITGIITEKGVIKPPFKVNIKKVFS